MSNVAIIFAGGVGRRMGAEVPKQFLKYEGKEVLVYTIETFQKSEQIDAIAVACLSDYIEFCLALVKKYELTKVKWIVPGGNTGQESIFNGLDVVYQSGITSGYAVISDGVRPLVTDKLICDCISTAKKQGGAIAAVKAVETAVYGKDGRVEKILDRERVLLIKAPQVFPIDKLYDIQKKALSIGDNNNIDTISLMTKYGYSGYGFVMSDYTNIKITTKQDFELFKAYKRMKNDVFAE